MGADHDESCRRVALEAGDAELALAMQVEEVRAQQLYQQQMHALYRERQNQVARERQLWDPLFGEITLAPSFTKRLFQHMCFACCPCAMVACDGPGRRVWKRFLLSWSFTIAVLQIAALVTAIALSGGLVPWNVNPMIGPHYHVFDAIGAKNAARIHWEAEWWRLFTPILLHAGVLHLVGNLTVQLRTGAMLETVFGHTAWLFIYIVSGAYGELASCAVTPNALGVGSSGALCGLLGAWCSFILITWNQTSPVDIKLRNAQTFSVGISVGMIVAISFVPLMDFAAHIGGLVIGAALAMALFAGRLQHHMWRRSTRLCGTVVVVGVIGGTLAWFLTRTQPSKELLSLCLPREC